MEEWHSTWLLKSLRLDFILSLTKEKEAILAIPTLSQRVGERLSGRRTVTQAQLSDLPTLLAAKDAASNHIPRLADK